MKARILHVYKTYFPDTFGGCEKVIESIVKATRQHGITSQVISTSNKIKYPSTISHNDVVVNRFPNIINLASCPFSSSLLRHYRKLVNEADLIHYHFPWPFADLIHYALRIKKPYIITYHSDIVRQKLLSIPYSVLRKRFFNSASHIVATSNNLLKSSQVLQPYHSKSSVIPIGIDDKPFFPVETKRLEFYRKKLGDSFILFIGVMRYYKGLHLLLQSVLGTDTPLVIAGSGPEEKMLRKYKKKNGMDNVVFLGKIDETDKSALLQLCRSVVVPSHLRSEAFGVSLVEGLLFGKPLISTELSTGTSYVNANNKTGFVISANNIEQLKTALITLYKNKQLAEEMGKNSRKRYEQLFTSERMGEQYSKLYKRILTEQS